MKKILLIQLAIFAVFLIITGIFMHDNRHILHLVPERNQNLREGVLIGRLKAHGFYKRMEMIYVFQQNSVKFNETSGLIDLLYCGPAMSDKDAKILYDTLQYHMEHPETLIRKTKRDYSSVYNTWSDEPKSKDTIKWRLFHR
jgi:hypothetical protein